MTPLALLIIEHLNQARGNMIPDGTLYIELKAMTHPVSSEKDWKQAIKFLRQKKLIGFDRDEVTDELRHYITQAGRTFWLGRNQ